MSVESLADAITRAGTPVDFLRNLTARPSTFPVQPEFTNWRSEQRAWRESCALLDQSHHMNDLFIQGPDAGRLLTDLGVNSFKNFGVNKAKQFVAVNPDGYFIGDAILFHLDDDLFDLVGHPTVHYWVEYHAAAGGYDVSTEHEANSIDRSFRPRRNYRYELQGPAALEILEKAAGPVPATKFFHMCDLVIAGRPVRGLRHGMAGQPGFELFGPWQDREAVLAALLGAGDSLGIVRAGAKAYSTANLESGWLPSTTPAIFTDHPELNAYRQWLPADAVGALGGSFDSADIADYYVTPYDIGYGRTVAFDHDFTGSAALRELSENQRRTKVTLVWNSDDVTDALGSLYRPGLPAKYIELPKARYALYQADKVLAGDVLAGISMDCGYLANEHVMVSLATVDIEHSEPGTEVTVLWGEQPNSRKPQVEAHQQVAIRATVAPAPYLDFARQAYRSR